MRINHNISALNAWRNLGITDSALTKSLERLSSGLRINRAADDAAGLAISEKMRAQVRGLNQAIRNAQDGVSLIQTAEGALNETHSILQRMRELAVQASNETATPDDREAIQDELNQLIKELDRIAATTEFNTQKLLDGTFTGKQLMIGANAGQVVSFSIADMAAGSLGATWGDGLSITESDLANPVTFTVNGVTISLNANATVEDLVSAINAAADETGVKAEKLEATVVNAGAFAATVTTIAINGVQIVLNSEDDINTFVEKVNAVSAQTGVVASKDSSNNVILTNPTAGNISIYDSASNVLGNITDDTTTTFYVGVRLYTSLTSTITVAGSDSAKVGLGSFSAEDHTVRDVSVDTVDNAKTALKTIDFSIQQVSKERSLMGALQNRLEHTVNNLGVAAENLTAAESRIRDVDMAQEMMEFVKNQIILQSGTAMLAQANVKPQAVLQLLA